MAIDSAEKRLSMLNFGDTQLSIVPDNEIGEGDRFTLLGLYSREFTTNDITIEELGTGRRKRKRRK